MTKVEEGEEGEEVEDLMRFEFESFRIELDLNLIKFSSKSFQSILLHLQSHPALHQLQHHIPVSIHSINHQSQPRPWIVYIQSSNSSSSSFPTSFFQHFFPHQNLSSSPIQLSLTPVKLIPLKSVYLLANDIQTYRDAQSNPSQLRSDLAQRIIRQSDGFQSTIPSSSFTILLTDPVLQGSFDINLTSLTLLAPLLDQPALDRRSLETESDSDELEIEPDFLARSALRLSWPATALNSSSVNLNSLGIRLRPIPLHSSFYPPDPLQAFVRTTTLAQLGICTHDWVLLHPTSDSTGSLAPPTRLLRISASPDPHLPQDGLLISPILLEPGSSQSWPTFNLSPARLHLPLPPRFPTIRSLTLARVASAHPGLKQLQPLFLSALSDHFRRKPRVLKLHDLVPVAIDPRLAQFFPPNPGTSGSTTNEEPETDLLEIESAFFI